MHGGLNEAHTNKPEDIDLDVLEELIELGWNTDNPMYGA